MPTAKRMRIRVLLAMTLMAGGHWFPGNAASAPPESAAVSFGSVVLTTEPGAIVVWDSVEIGRTDSSGSMSIEHIPPDTYSIAVRREGFEPLDRLIEIAAGSQTLDLPLVPVPGPDAIQPDAAAPTAAVTKSAALPDPFARRKSSFVVILPSALLLLVALGAWFLMRRRAEMPEAPAIEEIEGPRLAFDQSRPGPRRPPGFYDELRQREATLESYERRRERRPSPKIIELPVPDRDATEDET